MAETHRNYFDQRDSYLRNLKNRVLFSLDTEEVRNKIWPAERESVQSFIDVSYNEREKRIEVRMDTSKMDVLQIKAITDELREMEKYFLKVNDKTTEPGTVYLEWSDPYNKEDMQYEPIRV